MIELPSPSLSVLKQYLQNNDFEVEVIYWNLKFSELQCQFLWTENPIFYGKEKESLFLFFNYLAITYNDKQAYNYIKTYLMTIKPQYMGQEDDFFDTHMRIFSQKVDLLLNELIEQVFSPEILCYGMSVNLYQWVCSSIIAKKIKQKSNDCIIVIGGIGTKESAIAYLENFDIFDFAIWGEGEIPLISLCKELSHENFNESVLTNTAFRIPEKNQIFISDNKKNNYVDLSSSVVLPDYSDYEKQKTQIEELKKIKISIPIESSRGCHWRRCHFCYLNTGYRFRLKSIPSIIEEIKFMIKKYDPESFNFLDNDIIGGNIKRFDQLLDELIILKEEFPDFNITLAEVITKGINASIIKKMSLAGFTCVQIGYESASNSLLRKISKKNSFASNLLFIKFANSYRINVNGANVIMGLLEETRDDISEAIHNLQSLRFFLKQGRFRHHMSPLGIMHSSPYYEKIKDELPNWKKHTFIDLLPEKYLKNDDTNHNILEVTSHQFHSLWNNFQQIEQYYINNFYEYDLIGKNENVIYRERLNGEIINELEFEKTSADWFILEKANDSVVSFDDIRDSLKEHFMMEFLNVEIFHMIEELLSAHLIYTTDDYSEILTIIDINNVL
jgi:Fe-S oxidoreductase